MVRHSGNDPCGMDRSFQDVVQPQFRDARDLLFGLAAFRRGVVVDPRLHGILGGQIQNKFVQKVRCKAFKINI